MSGEDADFVDIVARALRFRVKRADRFNLVVKKVEPEGGLRPHRKDVDDPAAHTEFARSHDLLDAPVPGLHEVGAQDPDVKLLPLFVEKRRPQNKRGGRKPLRSGCSRRENHVAVGFAFGALFPRLGVDDKFPKRLKPFAYQVLVRTHRVVGKRLPVGEHGDSQRRIKPGEFVGKLNHVARVGADDDRKAFFSARTANDFGGRKPETDARVGRKVGLLCGRRQTKAVRKNVWKFGFRHVARMSPLRAGLRTKNVWCPYCRRPPAAFFVWKMLPLPEKSRL